MGLTQGVATNDDTGRATAHLARLGLDRYLGAVVTLQPGLARKPAPDLYLRALKLLDLDPATTIAIEDSSHGVEAAHRAGMRAIAYPTPTVSLYTDLTCADLVVADVAAASLTSVLAVL
jgi:putative hydrolase of the HAD superfamily